MDEDDVYMSDDDGFLESDSDAETSSSSSSSHFVVTLPHFLCQFHALHTASGTASSLLPSTPAATAAALRAPLSVQHGRGVVVSANTAAAALGVVPYETPPSLARRLLAKKGRVLHTSILDGRDDPAPYRAVMGAAQRAMERCLAAEAAREATTQAAVGVRAMGRSTLVACLPRGWHLSRRIGGGGSAPQTEEATEAEAATALLKRCQTAVAGATGMAVTAAAAPTLMAARAAAFTSPVGGVRWCRSLAVSTGGSAGGDGLDTLPVGLLPGCGRGTRLRRTLNDAGVRTIRDFRLWMEEEEEEVEGGGEARSREETVDAKMQLLGLSRRRRGRLWLWSRGETVASRDFGSAPSPESSDGCRRQQQQQQQQPLLSRGGDDESVVATRVCLWGSEGVKSDDESKKRKRRRTLAGADAVASLEGHIPSAPAALLPFEFGENNRTVGRHGASPPRPFFSLLNHAAAFLPFEFGENNRTGASPPRPFFSLLNHAAAFSSSSSASTSTSTSSSSSPSVGALLHSLVNELASRLDRASSTHGRRPPVLPTDSSSSSSASSASATPSPPSCEPSLAVAVRLARLNASLLNDDDVDDSKDMSSGGGSWFAGMAVPFPSATFWRRNDSNASRRLDGRCQALLPVVAAALADALSAAAAAADDDDDDDDDEGE